MIQIGRPNICAICRIEGSLKVICESKQCLSQPRVLMLYLESKGSQVLLCNSKFVILWDYICSVKLPKAVN